MREFLQLCAKVGIALFVLWHMAAVAIYSVPGDASDPIAEWSDVHLKPHVMPYLLLTSQWQQWNLFAPNPLRRIIFYRFDVPDSTGEWRTAAVIDRNTYGPWRHATRFKMLGQVFEEDRSDLVPLTERATQILCGELGLPAGPVRVWHLISVIPYVAPNPGREWWEAWAPSFEPSLAIETDCPPLTL